MTSFDTRRRVEFADTDLAGICHFARFFVFLETAEHELLRSLGGAAWKVEDGRAMGWPRVEASCRYLSPAFFGDELEIRLTVERLGSRSVTFEGTCWRGETRVAVGRWTAACCWIEDPSKLEPTAIPDEVASGLAAYLSRNRRD